MSKHIITQSELKELLHYDHDTGIFTWLASGKGRRADLKAGCHFPSGYWRITINGVVYRGHNLAFLFMTGQFPSGYADHINHIKDDNRWCNLRDVDRAENCKNLSKSIRNKSGFVGVSLNTKSQKYHASINVDGKLEYLGSFSNIEDAIEVRKAANIKHNYHPLHGK